MHLLLDDLKKHHEFLTHDNLLAYGGSPKRAYPILSGNDPSGTFPLAVIEQDRRVLDEQVRVIKSFTDKNIAHVDADALRYPTPPFCDLDRAIDLAHTIFRKYALLIAGYNCQLDETRPEGISRIRGISFRNRITTTVLTSHDSGWVMAGEQIQVFELG